MPLSPMVDRRAVRGPRGVVEQFRTAGLDLGLLLERARRPRKVIVGIAVHNGGPAVARCLDAVSAHSGGARVVVVDDASTDDAVVRDLVARADGGELELIRHADNWGYTRTANQLLHLAEETDVVLLNSDTEVGPGWLVWLRAVAFSRENVATVSALSDNAGAFGMPYGDVANEWSHALAWSDVARVVARADAPPVIEAPTGHGFCMLVTRAAIEVLGGFDEVAFPRGYGEENDFCMRARERGMVNLIAPRVFVRHLRSQSFGAERSDLIRKGAQVMDSRHPGYAAEVGAWLRSPAMAELRASFATIRAALPPTDQVHPRRLYVLHRSQGGAGATTRDLISALKPHQESFLLESVQGHALELWRVTESGAERCLTWKPARPFRIEDGWRQDYAEVVAGIVLSLGIELVHIRHLVTHPLTTMSQVCRRLNVPFVLSTHDFYMACPTIHLLDAHQRFCGGVCTQTEGECAAPMPYWPIGPALKHRWVHEWRRRASSVFEAASAVVATTESAANILGAVYPRLRGSLTVIEHGRDIADAYAPVRQGGARRPGPVRVVAAAHWAPHKGLHYLEDVARLIGPGIEWHILGSRSELLADIGVVHGPYNRDTVRTLIAGIDPDFAAIFSICPETYSHTLSEAWALGLPVLATDLGAVAERIRVHGGGVLLPPEDPEAAARRISLLIGDPDAIAAARASVPRDGIRTAGEMAAAYRELYRRVESGHHWASEAPPLTYVAPTEQRDVLGAIRPNPRQGQSHEAAPA